MSGSIVIDLALAPVYVVTFSGAVTDAEFDQYLAAVAALFEHGSERALVYDARRASPAPASQRRKQAAWMKSYEREIRKSTAGIAFVIPSPLVRGALTAILWLQPLACHHLVTGDFQHALAYARERLALSSAGPGPHASTPDRRSR